MRSTHKESPAVVLSEQSPAYKAHEHIINELIEEATRLDLITQKVVRDVFEDGIVCDRGHDRERTSVSNEFHALAKKVLALEVDPHATDHELETMAGVRSLLHRILAAHLSIAEQPPAVERSTEDLEYGFYVAEIQDLEKYCADQGIPSLLPHLFQPWSLRRKLEKKDLDGVNNGRREQVYGKLAQIFRWQNGHIHEIMSMLQSQGKHTEALNFLEKAAAARGMDRTTLACGTDELAQACVVALSFLHRHGEVLVLCKMLGKDTVESMQDMKAAYVRAIEAPARRMGRGKNGKDSR